MAKPSSHLVSPPVLLIDETVPVWILSWLWKLFDRSDHDFANPFRGRKWSFMSFWRKRLILHNEQNLFHRPLHLPFEIGLSHLHCFDEGEITVMMVKMRRIIGRALTHLSRRLPSFPWGAALPGTNLSWAPFHHHQPHHHHDNINIVNINIIAINLLFIW